MNSQAQVSIELLLLTAAFLGVLALFVPVFQTIFSGGLFGLEALKAKSFCDSFQQKTALLNVLGNNSQIVIKINPSQQWNVRLQENLLELFLAEPDEKEKKFSRELSFSAVPAEFFVSGPAKIILKKENGFLIVNSQLD